MAYSAPLAAELSGVTVRQLSYWRSRKNPVLVPEGSEGGRVLYSFRDLVALRAVSALRDEVSLQRIRKALDNLGQLGHRDHLSGYSLRNVGHGTIVLLRDEEAIDLVSQPGHMIIRMEDVLGGFVNGDGKDVPDLRRPRKHLRVAPSVLAGYPVAVGTRVPFSDIAELVLDGVPAADIASYYPSVTPLAARDSADLARVVELQRPPRERRILLAG